MTDDEFHEALHQANATLLNAYFDHGRIKTIETDRQLYMEKDATFMSSDMHETYRSHLTSLWGITPLLSVKRPAALHSQSAFFRWH